MKYAGGCDYLLRRLGIESPCCGSCHSDEEDGFPSFQEYDIGEDRYEVCCLVKLNVEKAQEVKP